MVARRAFVGGLLAAGACPSLTWADAGHPVFLSAARRNDGRFVLCGIDAWGQVTFQHPLPGRGHAAAGHPYKPEAVAFARRPGTFAIILDCRTGQQTARLDPPVGRHFYGHGTFSADGTMLFTTENNIETAEGLIGLWDASNGYRRIGEMPSGGIGPHDIKCMPNGNRLVVANGGIETHPETGRSKLNLPTMRASLCYMTLAGDIETVLHLPDAHQRNSIRHLAVARDGSVAFAMQWQGDLTEDLPLLGRHRADTGAVTFAEAATIRRMHGYLGSVALSDDGQLLATTSPRSGRLMVFHGTNHVQVVALQDVCGVAQDDKGFYVTTGKGLVVLPTGGRVSHPLAWDNHLIAL